MEPIEESDLNLEKKIKKGSSLEDVEFAGNPNTLEAEGELNQKKESFIEKDGAYAEIMSKLENDSVKDNVIDVNIKGDAENVSIATDTESQIQHLVDIAETKGIIHAVKVAKHINDNYVLDALHDRLTAEDLHRAFVEKGLIKE